MSPSHLVYLLYKYNYLCSNSVGTSREKLCNTSSVQTGFRKTKGGTKTSTASTNHNSIIFMINDGIFGGNGSLYL
jgi:alkaline phosphatase